MKIVWLLVIFFGHIFGSLIYYFTGKPMGTLPGEVPRECIERMEMVATIYGFDDPIIPS